ncbi:flagellar export chaperone FliS [Parasphingorhabdus cellanae]|uniref:Flagellar protein FliS n=1 Tax=Parasphingorhabdus cellanae TaxID=2806553 RepID=A0ABX7T4F9_9SPHN|nr:flagellar protein FliS [Parasphingorhabdus cellanae]QTD56469.1 flagellar protein FliS [Parasphingorhabdus cellanae]
MMHSAQSGYAVAGKDTRVLNANAHELITILFEELLNLLDEISIIHERGKTKEIVDQQVMALSIVDSLIVSLDMENGGELAENLRNTYAQVRALIAADDPDANLRNNRTAYKFISEIYSAWRQIA